MGESFFANGLNRFDCKGLMRRYVDALTIAVVGLFVFFFHLDSALLEPDEARYAEIPRLMLRSGDWITPRLQGKPYNDKPPLVYWLIAGSYSTLGVSIESARLVPGLAGWLTLVVVYCWTRRYLGRPVAFLTGVILLSMLGYVAMMRMLLLDGVLAFLVVSSLLAGHHALANNRHSGWWLISAILCGFGVLTKGPVAIVLVTPCLFALRWLDRSLTPVRWLDCLWYGLVVLMMACPWYIAMLATNETFGSEFFLRHHLQRFLDPAHHERPFWFYFPALFLELLPWPFLGLAVWSRWRTWSGPERFLMFFSVWCFVFFSAARCKLPTYLLPILPTLAILIGNQLCHTLRSFVGLSRQATLLLGTLLLMALGLAFRDWGFHLSLKMGEPGIDGLTFVLAGLLLVGLGFTGWQTWKRNAHLPMRQVMHGAVAFSLIVTCWICHRAVHEYANRASVVQTGLNLVQMAEQEQLPYAAHRNSWDALSFALNRNELEIFSSREWPSFVQWLQSHPRCLVWMRDYENRTAAFIKQLPEGIEVERLLDFGKVQSFVLRNKKLDPPSPAATRHDP